jgi:hypothetical protein
VAKTKATAGEWSSPKRFIAVTVSFCMGVRGLGS